MRGDYWFGARQQAAERFEQLGFVESYGKITMNVSNGALQYVQVISDRRQLLARHRQDVVADPRCRREASRLEVTLATTPPTVFRWSPNRGGSLRQRAPAPSTSLLSLDRALFRHSDETSRFLWLRQGLRGEVEPPQLFELHGEGEGAVRDRRPFGRRLQTGPGVGQVAE